MAQIEMVKQFTPVEYNLLVQALTALRDSNDALKNAAKLNDPADILQRAITAGLVRCEVRLNAVKPGQTGASLATILHITLST